jgi:class I fructose-bisphosphate aldolase
MNLGKRIRLNRLFSHPSGRLAAVAVDHFINYGDAGIPPGLRDMPRLLAQIVKGRPDSITMHKGVAMNAWHEHAGRVAMILQGVIGRLDDATIELLATPDDAVRLGADALAVAGFVHGPGEARFLKLIADCVRGAARYEMPVVVHTYPRRVGADGKATVSYAADDIAWAARCAAECGADVIKAPFCAEASAYAQIVAECPVPLVAAGGPACATLADALRMLQAVVTSGARGAVVGRNVWSFPDVTAAVVAVRAVLHDKKSPAEAMTVAGLKDARN